MFVAVRTLFIKAHPFELSSENYAAQCFLHLNSEGGIRLAFHRVQRNVTINPCLRSLALAGYLHLSCFTGRFGPRVGLSLSLGKDKEKNMDTVPRGFMLMFFPTTQFVVNQFRKCA